MSPKLDSSDCDSSSEPLLSDLRWLLMISLFVFINWVFGFLIDLLFDENESGDYDDEEDESELDDDSEEDELYDWADCDLLASFDLRVMSDISLLWLWSSFFF